MCPLPSAIRGEAPVYWTEYMVQCLKVRSFDHAAGKTGKGVLSFFKGPLERADQNHVFVGQHCAVDVEDVIDIYDRPVLDVPTR